MAEIVDGRCNFAPAWTKMALVVIGVLDLNEGVPPEQISMHSNSSLGFKVLRESN